ncbi:hypothetical protein [Methanosarcina sp. MTP4]|uniref:hypothetical protein n=1 Tax=Methanosarcina sp. MTP4 TaxID=1434100 RepID=UPI0018CCCDE5|nr:hypothetical protein [Methanosarcina sp. MTP4]
MQPKKRTKACLAPTYGPSPCTEQKISLIGADSLHRGDSSSVAGPGPDAGIAEVDLPEMDLPELGISGGEISEADISDVYT